MRRVKLRFAGFEVEFADRDRALAKALGLDWHDAYMLASLAIDVEISQLVDPERPCALGRRRTSSHGGAPEGARYRLELPFPFHRRSGRGRRSECNFYLSSQRC